MPIYPSEIPLTRGQFAIVDACDFEWLNQWNWQASLQRTGNFYARRSVREDGKRRVIWMHREILGLGVGDKSEADHINTNGLDNRRENLRIASSQQNRANSSIPSTNTTGFKGVSPYPRYKSKPWMARIQVGPSFHYAYFPNPQDAAQAYVLWAFIHHGEFARMA